MPRYSFPTHRRQVNMRLSTSLFLISIGLLAGCSKSGTDQTGSTAGKPSQARLRRSVAVEKVALTRLESNVESVGFVESESQSEIAAGTSGVVEEILFREGQWVERDQPLVKVDQSRYETALKISQSTLEKAKAGLDKAKNIQGISLGAGIGVSREERARLVGDVRLGEAEVGEATANLGLAQYNQKRSIIRAPFRGQINQKRINLGSFVEDKTVIGTLADLTKLRVVGFIPERSAPLVRFQIDKSTQGKEITPTGLEEVRFGASLVAGPWQGLMTSQLYYSGALQDGYLVPFTLRSFPGRVFNAKLFYLSSTGNPDTHMFECKAELPPWAAPQGIRPGFTAKLFIPVASAGDTMIIPEESLRATERGFLVFRPKPLFKSEGKVEWEAEAVERLQTGRRRPGFVEILDKLRPGDWVVRRGAEALEDRTPLALDEETAGKILAEMDLSQRKGP